MTKLFLAFAITAALGPAQTLSQGERDRSMSALHAARKLFLDSVAGLTEAQWKFKPDPARWSIAECAEHIALSDDLLYQLITERIMKSPAEPEKKELVRGKDQTLHALITDRSEKFQAPEILRPTNRWPTRDALIQHVKESLDRLIAYVETTQDDLRSHFADHPAAKTLDAYQWTLLGAAHTERHTAQINEVKAQPDFPR